MCIQEKYFGNLEIKVVLTVKEDFITETLTCREIS
jgi:hypothetical protein